MSTQSAPPAETGETVVGETTKTPGAQRFPSAKGMLASALKDMTDAERQAALETLAAELGLDPPLPEPVPADGDHGAYALLRAQCEIEIKKCEREIARTEHPAHWYARQREIEKMIALSEVAETIPAQPKRFVCRRENATLHMYEMRDPIKFRRRIYQTDDPLELARIAEVQEKRPGYITEIPLGHVALLTIGGEWDGIFSAEDAEDRVRKRNISRYPHR